MAQRPAGLREPIVAFCITTALAMVVSLVGALVPFVRENLHAALIALIFFYAPAVAARRTHHRFDYREAGLRLEPVSLNLKVIGIACAVTFPLFFLGFFGFYGFVCGAHGDLFAPFFGRLCRHWQGWRGGHFRLPDKFMLLVLSQLVVVAIPEELFFRGYLMARLEKVWPPGRKLLGAPVGLALVVSSVLFAIGHVAVVPIPQRLAVFFPALLFGWMRARTGSIAAGACYHALCNIVAEVLHASYFT